MDLNAQYVDLSGAESPRHVGDAVVALAMDPAVVGAGRTVLTVATLAKDYGLVDPDPGAGRATQRKPR